MNKSTISEVGSVPTRYYVGMEHGVIKTTEDVEIAAYLDSIEADERIKYFGKRYKREDRKSVV